MEILYFILAMVVYFGLCSWRLWKNIPTTFKRKHTLGRRY